MFRLLQNCLAVLFELLTIKLKLQSFRATMKLDSIDLVVTNS